MSFFDASEIASMQEVFNQALGATIQIQNRILVSDETEDNVESWGNAVSVQGWIFSTPTPSADVVGGVIGTLNLYRLFVPVGTVIKPGDKVISAGNDFIVIDTIEESTWLPILRVSLRRVE